MEKTLTGAEARSLAKELTAAAIRTRMIPVRTTSEKTADEIATFYKTLLKKLT